MSCKECEYFTDRSLHFRILTGHSEGCSNAPKEIDALYSFINDLIISMNNWSFETDGMPNECFKIYEKARCIVNFRK